MDTASEMSIIDGNRRCSSVWRAQIQ